MATARINIKSIDYFKFKKIIIDGNRDDYSQCSKEVKSFCDCVQTLNFRDEQFDDAADRRRFDEICTLYKDILKSKRIDALDMRIKSGWWGDHKNAYSAGKIKPAVLKEMLTSKTQNWLQRHNDKYMKESAVADKLEGPGLYVFKHKEHQCFQFVGRAEKIIAQCGERLRSAFEGGSMEPLAALMIITMSSDWDFYFIPVSADDDEPVIGILENDLILKHDCIWPHGLNFRVTIDSLLEVSEFRKSCIRHHWPPPDDNVTNLDLSKLRLAVKDSPSSPMSSENGERPVIASEAPANTPAPAPKATTKPQPPAPTPAPASATKKATDRKPERPKSAKSTPAPKPSKPVSPSSSSSQESIATAPPATKSPRPTTPRKIPSPPKPTSPAKKNQTPRPQGSIKPPARKIPPPRSPVETAPLTMESPPLDSEPHPAMEEPEDEETTAAEPPPATTETPVAEQSPPAAVKQIPVAAQPSPAAVKQLPSAVHPPPAAVKPPPATVQPASAVVKETPAAVKPPPATVQPASAVVKETPAAVKPPPAAVQPAVVVESRAPLEVRQNIPMTAEEVTSSDKDDSQPHVEASPSPDRHDENVPPVNGNMAEPPETTAPDQPKSTLKRSGTYEVLPGIEDGDKSNEDIQRPDVLDLEPSNTCPSAGEKPTHPVKGKNEKSRLPVSMNQ